MSFTMAAEDTTACTTSLSPTQPVIGKKRLRSFNVAFKLEVVDYAEKNTNAVAGRVYRIDESTVGTWRRIKDDLLRLPPKSKRLYKGGRKPVLPEIEDHLVLWIAAQRLKHCRVSRRDVQKKAVELSQACQNGYEYIASRNWLESFFRRKGICLRTRINGNLVEKKKLFPFVIKGEQQTSTETVKTNCERIKSLPLVAEVEQPPNPEAAISDGTDSEEEKDEEGSLAYIL